MFSAALSHTPSLTFSLVLAVALRANPTRHLYLDSRNNPNDILVGE